MRQWLTGIALFVIFIALIGSLCYLAEQQNRKAKKLEDAIDVGYAQRGEATIESYSVTVDYRREPAGMLSCVRVKHSNDFDDAVTALFLSSLPRLGETNLDVKLVHFHKYMTTEDALDGLRNLKLRPARMEEVLALLEKYGCKGHRIMVLGAPVGTGFVVCEPGGPREGFLCIYGRQPAWYKNWRFAAVELNK